MRLQLASARACDLHAYMFLFFSLLPHRNKIYLLTLHAFHVKDYIRPPSPVPSPLQRDVENQELSSNRCQNVSTLFIVKTRAKAILFTAGIYFFLFFFYFAESHPFRP